MFHLELAQDMGEISMMISFYFSMIQCCFFLSLEMAAKSSLVVTPCLASKSPSDGLLRASTSIIRCVGFLSPLVVDEMPSLMLSIFPLLTVAMVGSSIFLW